MSNRYHYVSIIARLTPTDFGKWINGRRGRDMEDNFLTLYLMNTRGGLWRYFTEGFACEQLQTNEVGPNNPTFSTAAFLLGTAYERVVNRASWLQTFRVNILCAFQKVSN